MMAPASGTQADPPAPHLVLVTAPTAGAALADALALPEAAALAAAFGAPGAGWQRHAAGFGATLALRPEVAAARSALAARLAPWLAARPVDHLVRPAGFGAGRIRALFDMESTLIHQEMLDELADLVGRREQVAQITARAMNGALDFAQALAARVGLFRGLGVEEVAALGVRITFMDGAERMARSLAADPRVTSLLVSGGFSVFAQPVQRRLGLGGLICNHFAVADGRLSGTIEGPLVDAAAKRAALAPGLDLDAAGPEATQRGGTHTIAVGDGANDLPMLQGADLGIAFRAKPKVRAQAPNRIDHADLTAVALAAGIPLAD